MRNFGKSEFRINSLFRLLGSEAQELALVLLSLYVAGNIPFIAPSSGALSAIIYS